MKSPRMDTCEFELQSIKIQDAHIQNESKPKEQIFIRNWPDPKKQTKTIKERREVGKDELEPSLPTIPYIEI